MANPVVGLRTTDLPGLRLGGWMRFKIDSCSRPLRKVWRPKELLINGLGAARSGAFGGVGGQQAGELLVALKQKGHPLGVAGIAFLAASKAGMDTSFSLRPPKAMRRRKKPHATG